jgi:release factor glutamine methyltransferase
VDDVRDALVERLRAAGCVFAEDEALVLRESAADDVQLEAMTARRVAGEPLEAVVGWASFCGLRVLVSPGVFVPRTRTELLAETALDRTRSGSTVVDLCCGTGAVGLVVASHVPGARVHGADVEPDAVACARRNLEPLDGHVHEGDLFAALPRGLRGTVDVLAVNAPYVPTDAVALMPPEARDHEPLVALDGGADGLDVHRRVAAEASAWLSATGVVMIETSLAQAPGTASLLAAAGLVPQVVRDDDRDATVVLATRPGR